MQEFLDRTERIGRVAAFLSEAGGPRVLCVTGPEGCGKSELLRQAVARFDRLPLVSVDRARSPDGLPNGSSLVRSLSATIEMQAVADGFPLRRTGATEARRRLSAVAEASLGVAARVFRPVAGLVEARDRLVGLAPHLAPEDADSLYVRNSLREVRCVLHVDHAEGCDRSDWQALASLLSTTECLVLLEGGPGFSPPGDVFAHPTVSLDVPSLEMDYASVLFRSMPAGIGETLTREFLGSGNLKPYAALASRRHELDRILPAPGSVSDSVLRFATVAYERLDTPDRQVLLALCAHAGNPVGLGMMRTFLAATRSVPPTTTELTAVMRRLDEAVLIVRTSGGVRAQDVVFGIVANDPGSSVARLVYQKEWRDFYHDPDRCGLPAADQRRCLQALRQSAVLKDTVGIASTLESIGILREEAGSRADSVSLVIWLVEQFDLVAVPEVAVAAARYLYVAGWFERARDVLLQVEGSLGRRDRYLLAELYCAAGPHRRGINMALHEQQLAGERNDADAELCLELVVLHGLRNSDRFEEARTRYGQAIHKMRFRDRVASTVLYRFADLCLMRDEDFDACRDCLERAADLAVERGQGQEAVSAYVALCQLHGYHDLDRAGHYLGEAAEAAEARWVQLPALLNNRAVIDMYRGIVDEAGVRGLEDALMLASDPLDELLIRSNIVVHRMLAGRGTRGDLAEISAGAASATLDTEIRKIVHFNLEQSCRTLGDNLDADRHGEAWRRLPSTMDSAFWRARASGTQRAGVPPFRLEIPYYPVFLSHWKTGTVPFDAVADDV